jgi:hypothetical protein|tara:strand:- start:437 stop:541 length:105 start_codon:yes stop_codon:yes gene_type:complete
MKRFFSSLFKNPNYNITKGEEEEVRRRIEDVNDG